MKKIVFNRRFVLLVCLLCLAGLGMAQTLIDGIYYNLDSGSGTAEVTSVPSDASKYSGSISIPENVTYGGATYSVTSIGEMAFSHCSGLTSITIPNSVTRIEYAALLDCPDLTTITVDAGNTYYDSRNNCNAIIETATGTLIAGCKNTVIPNSVTSIGDYAFYCCYGLTSVTIGNSVTSIGDNAFEYCSGLTSIEIPNSVTSIGDYSFKSCPRLTSITIPNSVTSIGFAALSDCSDLTTITVDAGNTYYDSRNNCNAIIETATGTLIAGCKNTVIPNSVTSIGRGAFFQCTGLTSITIPNSVTSIGNSAFSGCSGLTYIEIPNSVTSIGNSAFSGCSGLTSIEIPNSVTSIGDNPFSSCSGLTTIIVDAGNTYYDSRNNCNAIIETATGTLIAGCKNTVIPNSVTSIGRGAFFQCTGLTSITIPNSVTSIGRGAFQRCSGLTSIEIPNSVTSIGEVAFFFCSGLTNIKMMSSTPPTTGSYVFDNCSNLTTVYVPQGASAAYNVAPWNRYEIEELALSEGYYYISDSRSPKYYIYNDYAEASKAKFLMCEEATPNEIPTVEDAKYIWHVTAGETAGQWYFENFQTGKRACNTTESTFFVTAFTVNSEGDAFKVEVNPYYGDTFIIMRATDDAQWNTAALQGNYICKWNVKNDPGNNFQFYKIDAASIAAIEEAVKQTALNKELEALYNTANGTYAGSRKFSGAPDGENFGDNEENLVFDAAQLESNAVDSKEGALANLLDGDYTTYFHTAYHAEDGPDPATWHNIQADLGKPVSALALKYARRSQNPYGCNPTLIQVLSTNDLESGEWTDNGTVTMTYTIDATIDGNVYQNFIGTCGFELAEPARYVRLLVKDRINGTSSELLAGYPFWYLSELHFYEGAYDPTTSPYELVPADVRAALLEQLANAKDELSTSEATQETLDALKAAYEAFLSLLPDSKRVTDAIAAAQAYHDAAPASAEPVPGYFPEEAKAAFQAAIGAVEVAGNMTLDQINTAIAALEAAIATFKASLYLPTVGSYYIIRSMSETYNQAINQAMVYSNTTATTGGIRFRSQVAESEAEDAAKIDAVDWKDHPNYVWYVEAAANGKVTLRNVLTGRYFAFQSTKNNGVQQSTTPVEVPVQSALIAGGVNFVVGEGLYANTAGGGLVVAWDSANGADNSAFGFEEVQPDQLQNGDFYWGVQSGKPQIITLPVAVGHFEGGKAYKLLGENADNEFVFEEIDEVEAGVPFLFVADEELENNEALFTLANGGFNEETEYTTVAQEQNGMQGTFESVLVDAGCGVFWGGSLQITTDTSADYLKNISANSGYFNGNHSRGVTAEGDYKIEIYGKIGEYIDTLDIVDNDAAIYALAEDAAKGVITYTRNYDHTDWQALYVPFDIPYDAISENFDVAELNMFHQYDDNYDGDFDRTELEVLRLKAGSTIEHHTPYVIRAKETGDQTVALADAMAYRAEEKVFECMSMKLRFEFSGTYSGMSGEELLAGGYYTLSNGELCKAVSGSTALGGFRWYLSVTDRATGLPVSPAALPSRMRIVERGEEIGDITGIAAAPIAAPCPASAPVYDLNGRRVGTADAMYKLSKGVYIVNGKKVIR